MHMQLELVLRLIISGILGAFIGWERKSRERKLACVPTSWCV